MKVMGLKQRKTTVMENLTTYLMLGHAKRIPILSNQQDLDDFKIRDLGLTKAYAESI